MYIKRDMEKLVTELSSEYPAILITGPRQVGKTTMLQKLMEGTGRAYVTLDDLNARQLAKTDPELFFQTYGTPILIDEVQYAPELFTYIKIMVDKNHTPGEFWLTGSQAFKLMQGIRESLAGRVAALNLFSLSQNEIYNHCANEPFKPDLERLKQKQSKADAADLMQMFERIWRGSMPAIASGTYSNRDIFYSSYISTYINRDVRDLLPAVDSLNFLQFITAVAARTSQLLNIAEIARDAFVDQMTAKKWLGILETLGLIFYLRPYSNNTLKRAIKTPKLYFTDCGLAVYLTKWSSPETLESGAMNGAIFENYVVSEIVKSYYNAGKEPYLYYYRDKDAREIDVIMESDGRLHPIEIKKSASPNNGMIKAFSLLDKATVPRGVGAVICMKNELSALSRENLIVPAWLI